MVTKRNAVISTTHKGVAFEKRSLALLEEHLSMSLRRIGGKDDGGIDLLGWWWLPIIQNNPASAGRTQIDDTHNGQVPSASDGGDAPRARLRILAQCKDEKKKTTPKYLRELEGVLYRYLAHVHASAPTTQSDCASDAEPNADWLTSVDPVVGLLISSAPFTKASLLRAHSSPLPLMLLHIPPNPTNDSSSSSVAANPELSHKLSFELSSDEPSSESNTEAPDGIIGSLVFNAALGGASGLLQGHVQPRWEYAAISTSLGSGRPGLWFEGRRLQSWTPERQMSPLAVT